MIQNGKFLAIFNSAHRVMKAENILKKGGFEIILIPAPRALSTDCGLAILYSGEINESILQALASEKLLPVSIYIKKSDTEYEVFWSNETTSYE